MKCPHCEEYLVITERQGIEIDYCPKCRGVWLDKGELDKLIEKAETSYGRSPEPGRERNQYNDSDRDTRYGYDKNHPNRKKRGGFFNDLFDFD